MPDLLAEQTAVVTGASSGIGRSIARTFAEHGADVVVADVREEPREGGTPTHELIIDETEVTATYVDCDVSRVDDLEATLDEAEGVGGVDVLVNNAGIFPTAGLDEMTPADWQQVININLTGTFNCTKAVLPVMRDQDYGRIVNISSASGGHIGWSGDLSHYAASKGGVVGFTRSAAIDLGPDGITMNAVVPGMVDTGAAEEVSTDEEIQGAVAMTPVGRQGDPEELAAAIAYLASEPAAFVTGASLVVDGGITLV